MILELTQDELWMLLGVAVAIVAFIINWMKSTSLWEMKLSIEKEKLPNLSHCSKFGDFMQDPSCKKLFNDYFLYRIAAIFYCCIPFICLCAFIIDAYYLRSHFLSDASNVFEKASIPMDMSILILITESIFVLAPLGFVEWLKRNTYGSFV